MALSSFLYVVFLIFYDTTNAYQHNKRVDTSLVTQCEAIISTCPPSFPCKYQSTSFHQLSYRFTSLDCASQFCATCTDLGDRTFNSCCAGSSPACCFSTVFFTETPTPDEISCSSAYSMIYSCAESTTLFTKLGNSGQASCLCYSSSTWIPDVFDGFWSHCYSNFLTADPSDANTITNSIAKGAFCTGVGNLLSAAAIATTTQTARTNSTTSSSSQAVVVSSATIPTATSTTSTASSTGSGSSSLTAASTSSSGTGSRAKAVSLILHAFPKKKMKSQD